MDSVADTGGANVAVTVVDCVGANVHAVPDAAGAGQPAKLHADCHPPCDPKYVLTYALPPIGTVRRQMSWVGEYAPGYSQATSPDSGRSSRFGVQPAGWFSTAVTTATSLPPTAPGLPCGPGSPLGPCALH